MEVWILLAAAGSGYLARRWQNSQKPKGSSADEAEDDNGAGPSDCMLSSRGRYRHFSSSGKRQVGKATCGKGSSYWARPKSTGNLLDHRIGHKVVGGEGGRKTAGEGHNCDNTNACEICIESRDYKLVNASFEGSGVHLNEGDHERSLSEDVLSSSFSRKRLSMSRESIVQTGTQDFQVLETNAQEEDSRGLPSRDSSYPLLFRSLSGKRLSGSFDGILQRGGQVHQDGYAGKRMKDAGESSSVGNHAEGSVFGSWMPGFWDVSEGVFVLDTESLLVQQGERSRGSCSSRKSRTPKKSSRSKGFRKRSLTGQKPMSSLESCLSAQLDEDYIRRQVQNSKQVNDDSLGDSSRHSSRRSGSFASEGKAGLSKTEFAIGLPSLSRAPSSKRFPSKSMTPRISMEDNGVIEEAFNPFSSWRYDMASGTKWGSKKGISGSSIKALLFNFGVGVGMMFTVMSNMREVRRLTLLLKEAEALIKDLEDELESKDEMKSDPGSSRSDATLERRQNFVSNTLRKVKSATESLCNMRMLLTNESLPLSTVDQLPSKDMSKLEAELEAELERMELSLGDEGKPKFRSKSARLSELDGEVGNLVRGELTILGLPHEVEVESEEDSSNSSHEDLHVRNYAVSPRALAKRLHEVLEARQEERISELESELKALNGKLQSKEEEVRSLKENLQGVYLTGEAEGCALVDSKLSQTSSHHLQSKLAERAKDKETAAQSKNLRSPNASPALHYTVDGLLNSKNLRSPIASPVHYFTADGLLKDVSVFNKGIEDKSAAFITLGGEALAAYKEACDEFSKLSTSGTNKTSAPESSLLKKHGKEMSTQDSWLEAKHFGVSEGWEQVDLLSLAEDFYGDGDSEVLDSMPGLGKRLQRERRGPRRKSRVKGHPEPEHQPFFNSRGVDSSEDATNDTSGSTPCSIKFMDVRTVDYSQGEAKQGANEESDVSISSYGDWGQDIYIQAGVNTPNQDEYHSIHPDVENRSGKLLASARQGVWNSVDDGDHYSELDEQLGQLLIKRIVEKSRKGSPIVKDAQTVLAHLEKNEQVHIAD